MLGPLNAASAERLAWLRAYATSIALLLIKSR
jgi:hypothetical protein